jgi:hypothetical protein
MLQKYLNYFPSPKISNQGSGEGERQVGSIVVVFAAKNASKIFELFSITKNQQPGERRGGAASREYRRGFCRQRCFKNI